MTEISNNLHGAIPQNVFGYLTPENWYLREISVERESGT